MTQRALHGLAFLMVAAPFGAAQNDEGPVTPDLGALLDGWRAEHGAAWRAATDVETGFLEMLYGGHTLSTSAPARDEEFFDRARAALQSTIAMHGIPSETLEPVSTLHLPLGIIGSNDKMTVKFRQVVRGVPVDGGFVNVLFDMDGRLLSIQERALPRIASFETSAAVTAERALGIAIEAFTTKTGARVTNVSVPELVIDQWFDGERRKPRLAWKTDVQSLVPDGTAQGAWQFVDAQVGVVYRTEESVHYFDVSGTVSSMATPGITADITSNPETSQPMRYLRVTSGATTTFTDANGNFTLAGVNAPASVTVGYVGTYNNVVNFAGAEYTLTQTLNAATGNAILMNAAPTEAVTAQANCFRNVNLLRDFIKAINPSDTHADIVHTSTVMYTDASIGTQCNAFFAGSGSGIFFLPAGGSCANFAFSTVISHEHGHWMNQSYGTGNGSDGMGEGNADVWALYVHDTPYNGLGYNYGSGVVRSGLNNRAFCGDANSACYGEVHTDGEPWMAAAWKVRANLNTSLGNTAGDLVANSLFLGWMNSYNQTQIKAIIETQWLTLDDNDGNLNSGTPHYTEINNGFLANQFPGVVLFPVTISNVTNLGDTSNQVGPYVVNATVVANQNPPLTTVQLKYRVNGGAFQTVNMADQGGNVYAGQIPGAAAPTHIEYYVSATNNAAQTSVSPSSAPGVPLDFDVGIVNAISSFTFEEADDAGWTHGITSGTSDDWQRGDPAGKTGTGWTDPSGAYTALNCWGTDIGNGNFNGAYAANEHCWLKSPFFNCAGRTNIHLRFNRWLSVQGSASDQARIYVNGTQVYINPTTNLNDGAWLAQDIDISAIANNNPSVQIQWTLDSNGSTNYGGWNLDDVRLVSIEIPCPTPVNYCVGAPNSVGPGAFMGYQGEPKVSVNNLELICSGCPAFTTGLFFYGANAAQVAFGNGFRCIGGTVYRLSPIQTDFLGDAHRLIDVNNLPHAIQAGEAWRFQFWYRNPLGGGAGFNLSDGLLVTFCP